MRPLFYFLFAAFLLVNTSSFAEDGYKLWLRYSKLADCTCTEFPKAAFKEILITDSSPSFHVIEDELSLATLGMLGTNSNFTKKLTKKTSLIIGLGSSEIFADKNEVTTELDTIVNDGFIIQYLTFNKKKRLAIAANTSTGLIYGTFHFLRLMQTGREIGFEPIIESPKIKHRILNHWDNLDRTVERGYSGFSIWDWHKLPGYIDQRYIDYARANASIGINGTVLTNVNANALVLSVQYIEKVRALADVFRPYGIKVYLTARFSAPIELGGLKTADPLNPEVQNWWKDKAEEIYTSIPDFGGFLVKANSEGQPGPQDYSRSHADGANMLADAIAPYGGIIMWRAFVYSHEAPEDRAKQANNEFEPLDGKFRDNVVIQVKNGAIDFQPREPFHPLFGAMKETALAMEFQITQEYLGQGTSLAYLAPMYKECLESDTYRPLSGTTVAQIIDGSAYKKEISVIAGVSNICNDINWTSHPLSQANWYAFGRLAWDHTLSSEEIASEWIKSTYGTEPELVGTLTKMLLSSREMVVNYMTPLGLHHIMGRNHHYGPGPWVVGGRADWTSTYYHRADSLGIGFNRTASGSNALGQYAEEISKLYSDPSTCP
ncbi:MAG: alpha-glucuronidase family glycosyl hydrolase, partial [Bacteroidales bacterium]|nr:alpha-glucuronidase family glycosyl hydrolase [Bacteroidales bacterium]